jgi:hypothetical protein
MIVFLFRPSPQVPRPSLRAAKQCYAACQYNIYMHRQQIKSRSVELTWIFTQSIFMAINTILWTLSYYEIRREHSKEEVTKHLEVALECISLAIERWPGVASALDLYTSLIEACLKIYDKDGDIPIAAGSPAESAADGGRSRTSSPTVERQRPVESIAQRAATPPVESKAPFGYILPQQQSMGQNAVPNLNNASPTAFSKRPSISRHQQQRGLITPPPAAYDEPPSSSNAHRGTDRSSQSSYSGMGSFSFNEESFDPTSQYNALPTDFNINEISGGWNPSFSLSQGNSPMGIPSVPPFEQPFGEYGGFGNTPQHQHQQTPVQYSDYLYPPSWNLEARAGTVGLNQQQQSELMHDLETSGTGQIHTMLQATNALFYPHGKGY